MGVLLIAGLLVKVLESVYPTRRALRNGRQDRHGPGHGRGVGDPALHWAEVRIVTESRMAYRPSAVLMMRVIASFLIRSTMCGGLPAPFHHLTGCSVCRRSASCTA
ncbi:MAG: hypothetical protein LC647_09180, partial [Beggiatoa sp.]|nr:hypothetical protein [Beggiatoa sp.]